MVTSKAWAVRAPPTAAAAAAAASAAAAATPAAVVPGWLAMSSASSWSSPRMSGCVSAAHGHCVPARGAW